MILILTNSQDSTADYLVSVLARKRIPFLRFDTDTGVQRSKIEFTCLTAFLDYDGATYQPEEFSNVWYRRPERLRHPDFNDTPEGHGKRTSSWV